VDTSKKTLVADQIEAILGHGHREVDAGVDCVGLEAHGNGEGDTLFRPFPGGMMTLSEF
jgi:glutathione-independent formaldehyde dehydrogenase